MRDKKKNGGKDACVSLPRLCGVHGLGGEVKPWSPSLCFVLECDNKKRDQCPVGIWRPLRLCYGLMWFLRRMLLDNTNLTQLWLRRRSPCLSYFSSFSSSRPPPSLLLPPLPSSAVQIPQGGSGKAPSAKKGSKLDNLTGKCVIWIRTFANYWFVLMSMMLLHHILILTMFKTFNYTFIIVILKGNYVLVKH